MRLQVNRRMQRLLLLIVVISEFSSAFAFQPHFLGSCWVPSIRNERKWHRDLTPYLSSSKSVENDAYSASVLNMGGASGNESTSAVVITGANGVLGQSLIWSSATAFPSIRIFATYRDAEKLNSASKKFSANASNMHTSNVTRLVINLEDLTAASKTLETCAAEKFSGRLILINNAGVCLEGNSLEVLQESLTVNCVSPAKINDILTALTIRENIGLTIVNISSGEGELVFLETGIQKEIALLETHEEWCQYIEDLINNFNPEFEYSFGPTPFYSLSKALLNAHTRIKGTEKYSHRRIYSVCPGNFQSSMSTAEELESQIPAEKAALAVLQLAVGSRNYESGKFYRNCIEIPW